MALSCCLGYVSWQKQQDVFFLSGRDLSCSAQVCADISGGFRLEVAAITEARWIFIRSTMGEILPLSDA